MLTLAVLPSQYSVCRLEPTANVPAWAFSGDLWSVTRTPDELSLVVESRFVPEGIVVEVDWRVLQVIGPLDFSLVGVLRSLTVPLADAGVSVFALSTYDTDYLLIKEVSLSTTIDTLQQAGFTLLL